MRTFELCKTRLANGEALNFGDPHVQSLSQFEFLLPDPDRTQLTTFRDQVCERLYKRGGPADVNTIEVDEARELLDVGDDHEDDLESLEEDVEKVDDNRTEAEVVAGPETGASSPALASGILETPTKLPAMTSASDAEKTTPPKEVAAAPRARGGKRKIANAEAVAVAASSPKEHDVQCGKVAASPPTAAPPSRKRGKTAPDYKKSDFKAKKAGMPLGSLNSMFSRMGSRSL